MKDFDYKTRFNRLGCYSLQRRRERYLKIYIWKIFENLTPPICSHNYDRRGCFCVINHVKVGRLGSFMYNSFRGKATIGFSIVYMCASETLLPAQL